MMYWQQHQMYHIKTALLKPGVLLRVAPKEREREGIVLSHLLPTAGVSGGCYAIDTHIAVIAACHNFCDSNDSTLSPLFGGQDISTPGAWIPCPNPQQPHTYLCNSLASQQSHAMIVAGPTGSALACFVSSAGRDAVVNVTHKGDLSPSAVAACCCSQPPCTLQHQQQQLWYAAYKPQTGVGCSSGCVMATHIHTHTRTMPLRPPARQFSTQCVCVCVPAPCSNNRASIVLNT